MRKLCSFTAVLALLQIVAGCVSTSSVKQIDRLEAVSENPKLMVITPDVKYYLLTAGGVPQPHAEWTEAVRINFSNALHIYAFRRGIEIITIDEEDQLTDIEISYQKLYSAVGSSILAHHFGVLKLPTKQGTFDWTLGPGVNVIGNRYSADYA